MDRYPVMLDYCYLCDQMFASDPELVPVVLVDPQTNKPPDIKPYGDGTIEERRARSKREPLCARCVAAVNRQRLDRGLPLIGVEPGAYVEDPRG